MSVIEFDHGSVLSAFECISNNIKIRIIHRKCHKSKEMYSEIETTLHGNNQFKIVYHLNHIFRTKPRLIRSDFRKTIQTFSRFLTFFECLV